MTSTSLYDNLQSRFIEPYCQQAMPYLLKARSSCQQIRLKADRYLDERLGSSNKEYAYELLQLAPIGLAFALVPIYVQAALTISSLAAFLFLADQQKFHFYYRKNLCISALCSGVSTLKYAGQFLVCPNVVTLSFAACSLACAIYCIKRANPERN
ncbi:MAG: hypothetical protein K0S07_1566 [Chlamydiales bacterium]|jgi:hypothetical protein|nr:hypothetical protein [Chlamydiales bacterium]